MKHLAITAALFFIMAPVIALEASSALPQTGMEHWDTMRVLVTAYGVNRHDRECYVGDTTATNNPATVGTVAVDPNVIPLGSVIYVPGYGMGVASDTGRWIKHRHIDVAMMSCKEAVAWGAQWLTVRIQPRSSEST